MHSANWPLPSLDNPEAADFRATVRRFIAEEITPHHDQWERDGQVPPALWRRAGVLGLLCLPLPEAHGGAGVSFGFAAIVTEEMARAGASGPLFYLHSDIVAPYILHYGTEAQKQRWLPPMTRGEVIAAIGMTEPGAGSDLAGMRSHARRVDDGWVLNGQKIFISNGQLADLVIVAAKTDPERGAQGVSLFLVPTESEGFSRGRRLEKIGMHAQDTSELFFTNLKLGEDALLGELGKGFSYMMSELPQERLLVAVTAIGAMEAALDWTRDYVSQRQAFGKPLSAKQVVRHKLAEVAADVMVARSFLDDCVRRHTVGQLDAATASVAKFWLTEMQFSVLDRCVQLFGGYGYMREFPIARAWADARVQRIYGGTTEIMKEIVARRLLDHR